MSKWKSSEIQSLLFPVGEFSASGAKRWAKDHGFRYGDVDTTELYHRLRQFEPGGRPCRTISLDRQGKAHIKAIVCAARNTSASLTRSDVVQQMANGLWSHLWMGDPPRSRSRGMPDAAVSAADDLARLYERANSRGLVDIAFEVEGHETGESPGELLALYATYDHEAAPIGLRIPAFGVSLAGDSLVWEGELAQASNPRSAPRAHARGANSGYHDSTDGGSACERGPDEGDYHPAGDGFEEHGSDNWYRACPLCNPHQRPRERPSHANPCPGYRRNDGGDLDVLVIEDDENIQRMYPRVIRRVLPTAKVHVVDNFAAAIGYLESHRIGLVISDVDIIGPKSGIDVFEWVREHQPDLVDRYVFVTGGNAHVAKIHHRYLSKPATADQIKEAIVSATSGPPRER